MPFTPKLTYKGKPLVRKDNELYYGCMTDPYVLYLQIQSTKTVGGVDVADKVHLQLLSTDESKPREARVARQTTKNGLWWSCYRCRQWQHRRKCRRRCLLHGC